ncbi:hypothetical protein PUN28_019815 [Cardiocondyla obscurior]|uniref:Uncharacterized protein n=1 Tax=Cardiocondyla obscurior TaxID=286306 RepID=A0AAW2E7M3_9HYME
MAFINIHIRCTSFDTRARAIIDRSSGPGARIRKCTPVFGASKKLKSKLFSSYHDFERLTFFRELSSTVCAADCNERLKSSTRDACADR